MQLTALTRPNGKFSNPSSVLYKLILGHLPTHTNSCCIHCFVDHTIAPIHFHNSLDLHPTEAMASLINPPTLSPQAKAKLEAQLKAAQSAVDTIQAQITPKEARLANKDLHSATRVYLVYDLIDLGKDLKVAQNSAADIEAKLTGVRRDINEEMEKVWRGELDGILKRKEELKVLTKETRIVGVKLVAEDLGKWMSAFNELNWPLPERERRAWNMVRIYSEEDGSGARMRWNRMMASNWM